MIYCKYAFITPTQTKDEDGFYMAKLECYNNLADKPIYSRFIDSFHTRGNVQMDFEYTQDGKGIRLWSFYDNGLLEVSEDYGPYIAANNPNEQ